MDITTENLVYILMYPFIPLRFITMDYTEKELNYAYELLADNMSNDLIHQTLNQDKPEVKYWYYVAKKYYELLWEYLHIASSEAEKTCDIEWIEAEQELSSIIEEFDNDTKENWWTTKRKLTWEYLAYYCWEYRWIFKHKIPVWFKEQ